MSTRGEDDSFALTESLSRIFLSKGTSQPAIDRKAVNLRRREIGQI